jgi:hypothetical protein
MPSSRLLNKSLLPGVGALLGVGLLYMQFDQLGEHPLTAPYSNPHVAAKLTAALPVGWRLARVSRDQLPPGEYLRGHGGEKLTFAGPTQIRIDGVENAREALEIWIMPRYYPEQPAYFALQSYQLADEICAGDDVKIFALTSRLQDHVRDFDIEVSDLYEEESILPPAPSGLAISWASFKTDICRTLDS